jgi:diguanylate cyclase (GGDEF)-like protein
VDRFALGLIGCLHTTEVLDGAMRVLHETAVRAHWAILNRVGPGRFHATVGDGVGHDALRRLMALACDKNAWLSVGRDVPLLSSLPAPVWAAQPMSLDRVGSEPEVVLASWPVHGAVPVDAARLRILTELVAAAVRAARVSEYLLDQTSRDALTGLLNRRGILELLERETARAGRSARAVSVLFVDLDRFKEINDLHGHAAGDRVLTAVAAQVARMLRSSDAVGRIGGDELLVVLPDTELRAAYAIGRRLAARVRALPVDVFGTTLHIGLTYGAASLDEGLHGSELIDRADRRMLTRKRRKHRVVERAPEAMAELHLHQADESLRS